MASVRQRRSTRSNTARALAELALHIEPAVRKAGRGIQDEPGRGGIQYRDIRLQGGEDGRLALADQLRDPSTYEPVPAVRRAVDAADHSLGIADYDPRAWGQHYIRSEPDGIRHVLLIPCDVSE